MKFPAFVFVMFISSLVFADNLFEGNVSEPVVTTKAGFELKLSAVNGFYNCSDVKVVAHRANINNVALRLVQIAHDLNKKVQIKYEPNQDGSAPTDCSIHGSEFSYNQDTGQFYIGQQ